MEGPPKCITNNSSQEDDVMYVDPNYNTVDGKNDDDELMCEADMNKAQNGRFFTQAEMENFYLHSSIDCPTYGTCPSCLSSSPLGTKCNFCEWSDRIKFVYTNCDDGEVTVIDSEFISKQCFPDAKHCHAKKAQTVSKKLSNPWVPDTLFNGIELTELLDMDHTYLGENGNEKYRWLRGLCRYRKPLEEVFPELNNSKEEEKTQFCPHPYSLTKADMELLRKYRVKIELRKKKQRKLTKYFAKVKY